MFKHKLPLLLSVAAMLMIIVSCQKERIPPEELIYVAKKSKVEIEINGTEWSAAGYYDVLYDSIYYINLISEDEDGYFLQDDDVDFVFVNADLINEEQELAYKDGFVKSNFSESQMRYGHHEEFGFYRLDSTRFCYIKITDYNNNKDWLKGEVDAHYIATDSLTRARRGDFHLKGEFKIHKLYGN